jgi:hypothetical protein
MTRPGREYRRPIVGLPSPAGECRRDDGPAGVCGDGPIMALPTDVSCDDPRKGRF